jgi:hypothetical protein
MSEKLEKGLESDTLGPDLPPGEGGEKRGVQPVLNAQEMPKLEYPILTTRFLIDLNSLSRLTLRFLGRLAQLV